MDNNPEQRPVRKGERKHQAVRSISEAWIGFEAAAVPKEAEDAQRNAMQASFYSGALAMLYILTSGLPSADSTEKADMLVSGLLHACEYGIAASMPNGVH